jgi:glucose-1-phosphate thymidylyltransferase
MSEARFSILLAAGRGTRMREAADIALSAEQSAAADRGLKVLVPIHGRPYLAYVLDEVAAAGFEEVCLVVGPDRDGAPDPVRAAAAALDSPLRVHFAEQPEPRGSADALLAAEAAVQDAPFVVLNADNIYPADVLRRLRALDVPGLAAFDSDALVRASNIPPERLAAFALVREQRGWLAEIVEKPAAEDRDRLAGALVSMTCWRFDRSIFDACRAIRPSVRGELELPDAVALALRQGTRFRVVRVHGGVLDLSRREDIPALERILAGWKTAVARLEEGGAHGHRGRL